MRIDWDGGVIILRILFFQNWYSKDFFLAVDKILSKPRILIWFLRNDDCVGYIPIGVLSEIYS